MFKYIKYTKVETEYTTLEFRGGDDIVKVNHFDVDAVSIKSDNESAIDALITSQAVECIEVSKDEFKTLTAQSAQVLRVGDIVKESFDVDVKILTEKYPLAERETWKTQLDEANKFLASSDEADAPFLKILADADGGTVKDFANAVVANNSAFIVFSANALAKKRALKRELLSKFGI